MADGQIRVGVVAKDTITTSSTNDAVIAAYLCVAGERGIAMVEVMGVAAVGNHFLFGTLAVAFQTDGTNTSVGTGITLANGETGTSSMGTPTIFLQFNEGDNLTLEVVVQPGNATAQRWTAVIELLSVEEGY